MKKLLGILFFTVILAACEKKTPLPEEKPELAPICPEGFYWIDSAKSCILSEDAALE